MVLNQREREENPCTGYEIQRSAFRRTFLLKGCNEGTMRRADYLRTSYLWLKAKVVKRLAYAGRITVHRKGEEPHAADIECPDRHLPM